MLQARARLLHTLDSSRTRSWVAHWLDQLRLGTDSGARARAANTASVARELIRSAAGKLRKRADRLNDDSSADDFHKVRIRAKRLRYALDAFGSLYGDAAREFLDALAKLQHVLGEYHDSTVRAGLFAELVTSGRRVPAATSFLVGRLVERDQGEFEEMPAQILKGLPANQTPPLARAAGGDARTGKRRSQDAGWRWSRVMDVYLVRHAIAHERNSTRWPDDALRPLTTAGMRKFRKAAAGLARCVPKTAAVFTSPFVRARETAAILAESAQVQGRRSKRPSSHPASAARGVRPAARRGGATPSCSSGTNPT